MTEHDTVRHERSGLPVRSLRAEVIEGPDQGAMIELDGATKTWSNQNIALPGCGSPWGVSIDNEGYVWAAGQEVEVPGRSLLLLAETP